jgi:hypothetical protein
MGIDGSHKLTILGHKRDLDEMAATKLCFPLTDEQVGTDTEYLQKHYFSNAKFDRKDKTVLYVTFEFRNHPVDFYLEELLRRYPKCWMKNEWYTEVGWCGFWIGFTKEDGTQSIQRHEWEELGWEEAHYWGQERDEKDDGKIETPTDNK